MNQFLSNKRNLFISVGLSLLIQNFIVYWDYWFGGAGIGRDFAVTYHAMVYHWVMRAMEGDFTQWVPTVAMGYPIQIDPQSAIMYAPFWILPIFKIPYSLKVALVFQLLHIWVGSFGVFLLLRRLERSLFSSFMMAMCFTMIGGFSHAAHDPDIIRGYALFPLLIYCLVDVESGQEKRSQMFLLPLLGLLFVTGVYPGIVTASFFCLIFFFVFQASVSNKPMMTRTRFIIEKGALLSLGVAMGAAWLLPIIYNKSELTRLNVDTVAMKRHFFMIANFFTTTFNSQAPTLDQSQDITMRSLFVGGAVMFFIPFFPLKKWKKGLPWLLLFSIGWALGSASEFYFMMGHFFKPLFFSRFLTSDYLPIIVTSLIVLSSYGLDHFICGPLSLSQKFFSLFATSLFLISGHLYMSSKLDLGPMLFLSIVIVSFLLISIFLNFKFQQRLLLLFFVLLTLNSSDFLRAIKSNEESWKINNFESWYQSKNKFDTRRISPGLRRLIQTPMKSRPKRVFDPKDNFFWRGWMTGEFSMVDYGITLQRAQTIFSDKEPQFEQFMQEESRGFFYSRNGDISAQGIRHYLSIPDEYSCGSYEYLAYNLDEVRLRFKLDKECIFFHNELYFPGWVGEIKNSQNKYEIETLAVGGLFRGYILPKGEHYLTEKFNINGLREGLIISIIAILVWVLLFLWTSYKRLLKLKHGTHSNCL